MTILLITKTTNRQYENKLSFQDRQRIAALYLEGYAIYNIANTYHISATTVQWHLKTMNVYLGSKRPTLWNRPITLARITVRRTLTLPERMQLELDKDEEYERRFPRSYKDYINRQAWIKKEKASTRAASPSNDTKLCKHRLPITSNNLCR